jgi:PPOX class probable FMN-dependent enzyme
MPPGRASVLTGRDAMDSQGTGGKPLVRTQEDLRTHFGRVSSLAEKKVIHRLDRFCRDFIALSPFLVLASSDGQGNADASPRGDAPGFVAVLDDVTLLIPDRRGNNRVDSFGNILASPGVGLIFFVPGINETLRINGRAEIAQEAELLTPLTVQNATPTIGLKISVEEAYFHCGKALMRSKLWSAEAQVPRQSFPSLGRIIAEQTAAIDAEVAEKAIEEAYRTKLY